MLSTSFSEISLFATLILIFAVSPPLVGAMSAFVDDADMGQITYTGSANIGLCPCLGGSACTCSLITISDCSCLITPIYGNMYNGTFHPMIVETGNNVFFTFTFTGISVEVKYVAADVTLGGFVTNTNVRYSIDGVPHGTVVRNPESRVDYVYDQTLLKVTGLTNVEHTLRVDMLPPSFLMLDHIIYERADTTNPTNPTNTTNTTNPTNPTNTTNDTSNSNTSNPSSDEKNSTPTQLLAAILGGTGAGVITLILGGVLVWYIRRKRGKRKERKDNLKKEPDVSAPRLSSLSPKSADVPAAPHQPTTAPYQPTTAPPPTLYQPPPTPFPPWVGSPQDPGWDEVNRHMSMASNQERNPTTIGMNNAPHN